MIKKFFYFCGLTLLLSSSFTTKNEIAMAESIVNPITESSTQQKMEEEINSSIPVESSLKSSESNSSTRETEESSNSTLQSSDEKKQYSKHVSADISLFKGKKINIISAKSNDKKLTVDGISRFTFDARPLLERQEFIIEPENDETFSIKNITTDKVLTVHKNNVNETEIVQQAENTHADDQKWIFIETDSGEYYIQSKSEKVIDLNDENELVLSEKKDTSSQKWKFLESTSFNPVNIVNGSYQIQGSSLNMFLSTGTINATMSKQLLISSEMYSKASKFTISKTSDGWYTITNDYSGLSLDLRGGSSNPRTAVQQYTNNQTDAQKFRFLDAANGDVYIQSKLGTVLDRTGGSSAENTLIQAYTLNHTNAQKWKIAKETFPNETIIADGTYNISSSGLSKNISLLKRSQDDGIDIVIDKNRINDESQQFSISRGTDGWYTISNKFSSKSLDVHYSNPVSGIRVQQYSTKQNEAQKFKFINAGNGDIYILSKLGTVLERKSGKNDDLTPVQTYQLNKTVAQKWKLAKTQEQNFLNIANGDYQITGHGSSKVFSLGGLSIENWRKIHLRDSTYSKADLFTIQKQPDGWYQITNKFSRKALDIHNGDPKNGAALQQYQANNSTAQKFRFIDAGDGYVYIESKVGTVLERPGASFAEGLEIKTYEWNKTNAQKWKIEKQRTPDLVTLIDGNRYFIGAGTNSNAVLEIPNGNMANSSPVQIWTEALISHQKFIPSALGNGWYKIQNEKTKKVLDVANGSDTAGTPLQQYDWNGSEAQQFRFINAGNGQVYIQSKLGTYLDIANAGTANGTIVRMYHLNKTNAQKFKLQNINMSNTIRTTVLNRYEARITVFNPNNSLVNNVLFPTWSRENGQNDIKWINGIQNTDGSWSAKINALDFNHSGTYVTDVYAEVNNQMVYLGGTNYYLDGKPTHLFVMGHGGIDPGAVGSGTNEREFTRNELLPTLKKYAVRLKKTEVIFYDPSKDMYKESQKMQGAHTVAERTSSVTEIHLDAGISSGGHVIVTPGAKTIQNLGVANVINRYVGWHPAYRFNNGLSERSDLLNLNVFKKRGISYRLVETGFISNSSDVAAIRRNKEAICKEIIEQVTGEAIP